MPHRDFFLGKMLSIVFRIVAPNLLTHDPAGRNAIDSNTVPSDFAGQAFCPGMYRSLGCECRIKPLRFGLARDVDDASPSTFDHLRQQRMRELPIEREIQRKRFVSI